MSQALQENGESRGGPGQSADVARMLAKIDARLERLEAASSRHAAVERALPGIAATVVDSLDDLAARLAERGIDVDARARMLTEIAERLTSPEALSALRLVLDKLPLLQNVLDSGILAEGSVAVVGRAGAALASTVSAPIPSVGLWGMARASGDEDVKRAIGFLLEVAKRFGQSLAEPAPRLLGDGR